MERLEDDLAAYFGAVRGMRSNDAMIRRPAISALLRLARQIRGPVQTRAEQALTKEFGPYPVRDGLYGCSAPFDLVEECDRNCRTCVWRWDEQPPPALPETCSALV
jgi:hypothetical protein